MKYQGPVSKYQLIFWFLVVGTWFLPTVVQAAVFQVSERVEIEALIQDDAYLAGRNVSITGEIGEDVMAAGNFVSLRSTVGDDAFLAGDQVVIAEGARVDDLFAAGRFVELQAAARVAGEAYLAGAKVVVAGEVAGDVRVVSEMVELADGAVIGGDLIIYGSAPPVIHEGAAVRGSIRQISEWAADSQGRSFRSALADWVALALAWFAASLVVMFLAPNLTRAVMASVYTTTLSSFGLGLAWLILMLPVIVVLLMTVIGWPLALLILGISFLIMLVAAALLPLVVGKWLHQRMAAAAADAPVQWQHALLGAVAVAALKLVPIIGALVIGVIWIALLGVLVRLGKKYA